MAFWGTDLANGTMGDPKRKFRWRLTFGADATDQNNIIWYAKTVSKPEINVSNDTTHKFLGHTFKFPGSVTWNDVEVTLVDPVSPDAARKTLAIIHGAGYRFPDTDQVLETISKDKAVDALKFFKIEQLDGAGNAIERWDLHNAFIAKVGFGELSYEDDGLSEISLTVTYDWAKWNPTAAGDSEIFTGETGPYTTPEAN